MNTIQVSPTSEDKFPWQTREIGYWPKFFAMTGAVLLGLFIILPLLFSILIALTSLASISSDEIGSSLLVLLIQIVVLAAAIFGMYKLWPFLTAATRATSKTAPVSPSSLGQPFEVTYGRPGWFTRTLSGKGHVSFQDESMEIAGTLGPNGWVQLGIILVVTVLPLALFGCGLGLIPALLLAYWVGRKNMTIPVRYADITTVSVQSCAVTLGYNASTPNQFKFTVMSQDGERLYRELFKHCPQAVTPWSHLLQQKFAFE